MQSKPESKTLKFYSYTKTRLVFGRQVRGHRMIPRVRGLLLAFASVVAISPDALLLVVMSAHAAPPTVLFYKCVMVGALSLVSVAYAACTDRSLLSSLSTLPAHRVLGIWMLQALNVSGFALSVLLTTPARAMLFIALNPVWASLIGVTTMGEQLPRRTLGAIVISLSSVSLMCTDATAEGEPQPPVLPPSSTAVGDAVALATGFNFALYLTALRLTAQQHARVDLSALSTGGFGARIAMNIAHFEPPAAVCYSRAPDPAPRNSPGRPRRPRVDASARRADAAPARRPAPGILAVSSG